MNAIYIRRRSKVVVSEGAGTTPVNALASLQKNLESLGFLLAPEVIERLKTLDQVQLDSFYRRLVNDLKALVGARRKFEPFYPNFPRQVMTASEAELYFNAIMHYWTLDRPQFTKEDRPLLDEEPKVRIIQLGSRDDFDGIFTLLARSKSPFSPQDKDDIKWFVAQYRDAILRLLPNEISCKENLAFLGAELIRNTSSASAVLDKHIQTATDVLRLAVALSDGDVSLATASKFGKFRRCDRTLMLGWIERTANRTEDMLRWKQRWIRLGERLHPGDYTSRFPQTAAAFDVLRNNRPFNTFNRQIESELNDKNAVAVLGLLKTRPGDLARRLDHLSRISSDPQIIVKCFAEQVERVSTPVLLQVLTHFRHRSEPAELRTFFPKGNVGNLFATTRPLPDLPQQLSSQITAICEQALIDRFARLPPLGKCYIDPRLKNFLVPFSQRSASKSLRTLVRGSRLPLPKCTTLRFFVWWRNGRSRVDIDLSAAMFDADYQYIDTLAYYNLKNFGAHHSGDIVDAPAGAAEFIDVDLSRCVSQRVRYIVMCLNSFTAQPYCDLPECFAGWMGRRSPNSGEVFEPRTLVDKIDVASNTRICLPAIFDVTSHQIIWTDIALTSNPRFANNVHNNLSGVSLMIRAITQMKKTDLHTLFGLHVRARGCEVFDIESAESIFAVDSGTTPFDLDRIAAEYM